MSEPAPAGNRRLRRTKARRIHELQSLRQKVADSDRLLDDFINMYKMAPIGLCVIDLDLRYLHINEWLAAINGVPIEEHLGRTIREVLPDVAESVEPQFRHVIETGEPILGGTVEAETPARPGSSRTFQHNYYPLMSGDATVVGVSCVVEDVTERKQAEKALQKARDELESRVEERTKDLREANRRLEREIDERMRVAARFEALLEAAPDPTISVDRKGRIVEVNERAVAVFGYRRDELIDQDVEILVPDHLRGRHIQHRQAFSRNSRARNMGSGLELAILCKDGRELPVEISLSPTGIAAEGIVIASIRDITLRKESEDALRESRKSLQRLVESTMAVPWEADARTWEFTYIGPQAEKLLGYPRERWLESGFWVEHIHPEDREYTIDYCLKSSKELDDYEFEYRMIASDGRSVWFNDIVNVVRHNGEPAVLTGFMIDITERKRIEATLQDLSARLIHAQEEERRRIARELHDDFSQRLALVTLDIEQLARERSGSPKTFDTRIHNLVGRINELSLDVHRLSHQLHPSALDHLGLAAAIKGLCRELSALHGLEIQFTDHDIPDARPKDLALCLYRIVQEALRNVIKHSGAQEAHVELMQSREELALRIRDPGVGFDVTAVNGKHGLGLISMRERLRLVGGRIAIKSSEARGTQIEVLVPLPRADAGDGNR